MSLDEFVQRFKVDAAETLVEERAASKAERPGVDLTEGQATVTLAPGAQLDDIPSLLAERGLSADDWAIDRVTVNKWESAAIIGGEWVTTQLHQLKVVLKPSVAAAIGVVPARLDGPRYEPVGASIRLDGPYRLFVVLPDQQIPHHDKPLHELVCRWLDFNRPGGMILSGDLIDLPTVSKHRHNPHMVSERDKALQAGIDQTYDVLANYVQAWPSEIRKIIPGNHEERFQNYLIEKAPDLYGVKRAGQLDPHSAFSVPFLIRADELGFDWVTAPNGAEWPDAELVLSPHLAIRHGWLAAQKSGQTAMKTLEHLGYSVIVGHSHRQSQVFKTFRQIDGTARTLTALEAGTLAEAHEGLGYSIAPDWQQGFAVVRMFDNGLFDASLARYVNGALIWEGQVYTQDSHGVKVAA